jgi:hypothetical protein
MEGESGGRRGWTDVGGGGGLREGDEEERFEGRGERGGEGSDEVEEVEAEDMVGE